MQHWLTGVQARWHAVLTFFYTWQSMDDGPVVEVELGAAGRNWERPPPPPLKPHTEPLGEPFCSAPHQGTTCKGMAARQAWLRTCQAD